MKLQVILAILIGIVMVLPSVTFLLSPQSKLRFQEVNIFSDQSVAALSNQEIVNDKNSIVGKLLHNHRVVYGIDFMQHYFDNLSPQFLFITGDGNPKFSVQDVGQLYLIELPFLLIGLVFLFRKKREGVAWYIIPLWLLLGIIPAATARETPHALRTEITLPTFQILVGIGLVLTFESIKNIKLRWTLVGITVVGYLCCFTLFQHTYWTHYPIEYSSQWQYGYKDAITYVQDNSANYDKVKISDYLGRPYIYFLFYSKSSSSLLRDPQISSVTRDVFGFVSVNSIGKYYFNDRVEPQDKNILYISAANSVPKGAKLLKTFYLKDGNPVLIAYTL